MPSKNAARSNPALARIKITATPNKANPKRKNGGIRTEKVIPESLERRKKTQER
jgi:hypothetical protein